jgi:hypothetical protein
MRLDAWCNDEEVRKSRRRMTGARDDIDVEGKDARASDAGTRLGIG